MSDVLEQRAAVPRATTRRSRRISVIWIIPLVAVAIGGWLAWDTWSKEGPTIRISFDSGEGLQPGQSQLKYRDIVFGTVKSLELAPDHTHVVVTVATTHEATSLLTDHTIFWVVKPRLFAGNVSGIETLLSGSYIGMVPGEAGGKKQWEFVGQEDPPILQANVPGHTFVLKAKKLGSISLGSPVFYRDLAVGEVLGWDIADMAEYATIRAFVRHPYDTYVHDETRFWNASGMSVKLAGAGVEVQMESLKALLLGGIAFETPEAEIHTAETSENHVFPLFADRDAANNASYTRKIPMIAYFSSSVKGLAPGSEVTVHGLKVGQVTEVRLNYDRAKDTVLAPVRFELEPERVVGVGVRVYKTDEESVEALVMPTTEGGGFAGLASSANDLLDKVNKMPFDQIGQNLNGILKSVNDAAQGPQLKKALTDLSAMIASAQGMVQRLDTKQLPQLTSDLEKTLTSANKLVLSLDSGYGDNTKFNRDLDRLMAQTTDAVRSIRALTDLLARHPEALVKGRPEGPIE